MREIQASWKILVEIVERSSTIAERFSSEFLLNKVQENNAIVNSKIEEWCQIAALGNWEQFENRLALDNLHLSIARCSLGSVKMRNNQQLPGWVETLNKCLRATASITLKTIGRGTTGKNLFLDPKLPLPFEEVLLPFIYVAKQKLIEQVSSCYHLLSEEAHASLERSLLEDLSHLFAQSMQLEFSIYCAAQQSTVIRFFEKFSGNYSTKHYQDFIKTLLEGELLTFFQKYPVLARLASILTDLWVDATKEFLLRLKLDWSEIQNTFQSEAELEQVINAWSNLSDRHQGGRSVIAIKFASGLQLIYKPKSLASEEAYFNLLAWLNEHCIPLPLKLLRVINRSTYGWVEFVKAMPCQGTEETKRYYQRSGMLLCLAYLLEMTDLHHENIVACGEHPVLIDLETLMHPCVQEVEIFGDARSAQHLAGQKLGYSVLRSGLLPEWQLGRGNQVYAVGGLGGGIQQETFSQVSKWHNINTDRTVLSSKNGRTQPQTDDLSSLEGSVKKSLKDYFEEIVDGFRQMYWFVVKHRKAILSPDGPLADLAHLQVRFVFRPTQTYTSILTRTLSPKFLRDGSDRSIQLDLLSRVMFLSDSKPRFWPLLKLEQQAMEQLDIPIFTASTDSNALTIAQNQILENYFTEPSFKRVVSRLNQLNNEDLELQISFIRGALYSHTASDVHEPSSLESAVPVSQMSGTLNPDTVIPLTREEMVQQAIAIAKDLQKQAICSTDGSATWIAPQYIFEVQRFRFQPISHSLHEGGCGVALFLAALEKVTNGAGFRDLALAALQSLHQDLQRAVFDQVAKGIDIGGGTECISLIYGLVRTSQLLAEPTFLDDAKQVMSLMMPDLIANAQSFDVVSGAAGAILGLLALYNSSADQDVLEQAITCGHHLLNHRVTSLSGLRAWMTLNGKLLTGFSHGAAGIAYALLRLYQVTGEVAFLDAAHEAIAYERSVFMPEVSNWPDLRQQLTEKGYTCMCSWCHGAPGIGLARVAGLDILDTPEIRQDIEAAINTTKQHKLSGIDHLCCGNLGRVEFLFTAARKLSQPQLLETAMQQAAQVVAHAKQRGHFGYGLGLTFHPGFWPGASGIGYELLRLAYPDQLPSVLLWE